MSVEAVLFSKHFASMLCISLSFSCDCFVLLVAKKQNSNDNSSTSSASSSSSSVDGTAPVAVRLSCALHLRSHTCNQSNNVNAQHTQHSTTPRSPTLHNDSATTERSLRRCWTPPRGCVGRRRSNRHNRFVIPIEFDSMIDWIV